MHRFLNYQWNRLRGLWAYHHRQTVLGNKPFIVSIEPTNICNIHCDFCYMPYIKRKRGFLTKSLFTQILQENNQNLYSINLFHHGEATLHPDLAYFTKQLRNHGVKVHLTTNGVALHPKLSAELLTNGMNDITVSFQGSSIEAYEQEQKGACFADTYQNIINLLEIRDKYAPSTQLNISIIPTPKQHDINKYQQFWFSRGINVIVNPWSDWQGRLDGTYKPRHDKRAPCVHPWLTMRVMWNGDVFPCCAYEGKPLGNLGEQTANEIWNDVEYQELRHGLLNDHSSLWESCSHCHGVAPQPNGFMGFRTSYNLAEWEKKHGNQ